MKRTTLSKVARSNLERLASSLEMSDHEWNMERHDTCALGQAGREFGILLHDVSTASVCRALELPHDTAHALFIMGRDENGFEPEFNTITKKMMVDTLRGWARTGKVRWVLE